MSIFMVAKCPDCLKVVASEVFGAGESTELFTVEYESNYIVEEAQTAPMIEGCQCKAELARLRAEVEILVWNLAGISTMACRRTPILYNGEMARPALDEVAELVKDYDRLRAENGALVEALKSFRPVIEKIHGLVEAVDSALSRAEQTKPETCVWTYEAAWVSGCGLQYINAVIDADMKFCPFCGKRVEVKE